MEIDKNLLKEFAQITNDSEVKTENKYLRGTIVKNSGGKYVRLDGSTTVTPISELVDVEEGDRVLVTIENHKATIVGNFTFPPSARKEEDALNKSENAQNSANSANETANAAQQKANEASTKADTAIDQASIASASANEAKEQAAGALEKADAVTANVKEAKELATQAKTSATEAKDQAAASQAASAEAQSEVTRLNGEVTQAQKDINNALEELNNQADEISAVKEKYATKIEVGNTKADLETEITKKVGELETTITENYSTKTENVELEGRLQTQITQNAEGLASQASKTEKLEADTTQAQKDVADALSKASAAQTSASEAQTKADAAQTAADTASTNATAAAEKATLAKNAADAATAAANAADKNVQSAKSDLDEAKKNLESVTSRVDATEADIAEAQGKVDAAQTAVNNALADAAEANLAATKAKEAADKAQQDAETAQGVATDAQTKANNAKTAADNAQAAADKAQADVAALTKRVTTAETNIKQNSEAIELNATKTTEIGTKVDNLKIGTRNLLVLSKSDRYTSPATSNGITISKPDSEGWFTISGTTTGSGNPRSLTLWGKSVNEANEYLPNEGGEYELSVEYTNGTFISGTSYTDSTHIAMYDNKTNKRVAGFNPDYITADVESYIYRIAYYIGADIPDGTAINGKFRLKLEKGNKPSDWTPAPEDINGNIDSVKNDLANNYYNKTETDAKIKVESDRISSTVTRVETVEKTANSAKDSIDNLEVGGRNYILNTSRVLENTATEVGKSIHINPVSTLSTDILESVKKGDTLDLSIEIKVDEELTFGTTSPWVGIQLSALYDKDGISTGLYFRSGAAYNKISTLNDETKFPKGKWVRVHYLYTLTVEPTKWTSVTWLIRDVVGKISTRRPQACKSNTETDWTPAPEDVDSNIADVENNIGNRFNGVDRTIETAQSAINQLSDMISHLVVDENGTSLMTQTSNGWTFNLTDNVTKNLDTINSSLTSIRGNQDETNKDISDLTDLVNSIADKTAYITMGKDDNGNPCIELGKAGNDFKVRITNTAIDFLQGSTKIAYANNNTFYATKMIVKNELQIGNGPGFVWKTRANGNMGLVYISG